MYEYGNEIEKRRLSKKQVYSYRFSPKSDSGLYEDKGMWNRFWKDATKKHLHIKLSYIVIYLIFTIRYIIMC